MPAWTSHSLIVLSSDPEASSVPSREYATERTSSVCPSSVVVFPVATSHSTTVPSPNPEASIVPSGERATEKTLPLRASKVAVLVPVCTFHSLIVLSKDPEANTPWRENATELTQSVCPSRVVAFPVAISHSTTVPSFRPEAMSVPSGENATDSTDLEAVSVSYSENVMGVILPLRASKVLVFCPVAMSHSATVPSIDPEVSCIPSLENTTELTAFAEGNSMRSREVPTS